MLSPSTADLTQTACQYTRLNEYDNEKESEISRLMGMRKGVRKKGTLLLAYY
jgi:hypothetical protein